MNMARDERREFLVRKQEEILEQRRLKAIWAKDFRYEIHKRIFGNLSEAIHKQSKRKTV